MSNSEPEVLLNTHMEKAAFPAYHQLANVLVVWNGKILMLHRQTEPFKGFWSIPGGGVKTGEPYMSAACRELYEEVGIEKNELQPMYVFVDHIHELESHIYQLVSTNGFFDSKEPGEHDLVAWKNIDEALLLPLTPGVQQALQAL